MISKDIRTMKGLTTDFSSFDSAQDERSAEAYDNPSN